MKIVVITFISVFLIGPLDVFGQTKKLYFDPGDAFKEQSLEVREYAFPDTDKRIREVDHISVMFPPKHYLNENSIQKIRTEALKRHISFRNHLLDGSIANIRSWWNCKAAQSSFKSLDFMFKGNPINEIPKKVSEEMKESNFYISLYKSGFYNIIGKPGLIGEYSQEINRLNMAIVSWYVHNIYEFEDGFEFEDEKHQVDVFHVSEPEIKLERDGEKKEYILYYIYEEIYDYRGVIAVNTKDVSDILFLTGPFIPLDNPLKEGFVPSDLYKGDFGRCHWESSFYDMHIKFRAAPLIDKHRIHGRSFRGFFEYTRQLSYIFCNESIGVPKNNSLYDNFEYKEGSLIIKRSCSPSDRVNCRYDEPNRFSQPESFFHYPNLLCSDYEGDIVSEIHFKFDLETHDISFKIKETEDISHIPKCSEKK